MGVLLFKIKFFDRPDDQGEYDDSFVSDLETLREEGAADHIAGPLPQQDGTVAQYVILALPALEALDYDLYGNTVLTNEVIGVRLYSGSFEHARPDKLRELWDQSRE